MPWAPPTPTPAAFGRIFFFNTGGTVAQQIRELAAHNDPDVIRQQLGDIADALENVAGPPPS